MEKTAILIGATGLTGRHLLNLLLTDSDYVRIIVLGRRTTGIKHTKIKEHIIDLMDLSNFGDLIKGDVAFCCVGTTKSKTPNKENYYNIDYGIPTSLAYLCDKNKVENFVVLSSMGANEKSRSFYLRTKGLMEKTILSTTVKNIFILRPSIIMGKRQDKRLLEFVFKMIFKCFEWFMIGAFESYKSIHAKKIAQAMIVLSKKGYYSPVIMSNQIQKLANAGDRA